MSEDEIVHVLGRAYRLRERPDDDGYFDVYGWEDEKTLLGTVFPRLLAAWDALLKQRETDAKEGRKRFTFKGNVYGYVFHQTENKSDAFAEVHCMTTDPPQRVGDIYRDGSYSPQNPLLLELRELLNWT